MVNELLVNLVNTVLGAGKRTARGNQAYHCPFCNHHKPKLEVNFTENKQGFNPFQCWVCGKKGKTIRSLFKALKVSPDKFIELGKLVKTGSHVEDVIVENIVELPKEFIPLFPDDKTIKWKQAYYYLKSRGVTKDDIIKYNIGYCDFGRYQNMIIIPSYDKDGTLNYFTGRSFEQDPFVKYRNPECSRDIIPFELFINWDSPFILCEGPFDAIAIKRNAIPLLGKNIQSTLLKRIVLNQGKEVYLVELDGKDPSDLGVSYFTKLIQNTEPINQYDLMEKKISLI